ncbi:hypothetical protein AURDEDRAFT_52233 [Auricularia subglabra TFB-10046 SS5]|nr:hypothetical protein AURDEDRAFT_52233 [Auricularia subglabra TFB-10046 SS5]
MSSPTSAARPKSEMKVLALGLPRSGTASITQALTMLGYENVHHGLKFLDRQNDWIVLSRAADATFPNLSTYTGVPFTRAQWDDLYGEHDAAADVSAFFGATLAKVYPEAKVLLVVRDFDSWFRSFDRGILSALWGPFHAPFVKYIEPLAGSCTGIAARKMTLGLFGARNLNEVYANARQAYDRHHRVIRETVPPEKLLVYRLGDGWEPLCKFLDKPPIPDAEFPRVNETADLKRHIWATRRRDALRATKVLLPWAVGAVAAGVGLWMAASRAGYI